MFLLLRRLLPLAAGEVLADELTATQALRAAVEVVHDVVLVRVAVTVAVATIKVGVAKKKRLRSTGGAGSTTASNSGCWRKKLLPGSCW